MYFFSSFNYIDSSNHPDNSATLKMDAIMFN